MRTNLKFYLRINIMSTFNVVFIATLSFFSVKDKNNNIVMEAAPIRTCYFFFIFVSLSLREQKAFLLELVIARSEIKYKS